MEQNPYEPSVNPLVAIKPRIPHSGSVRSEAWRGFKFGAKITACLMSLILAFALLAILAEHIYLAVRTNGGSLHDIDVVETLKVIGSGVVMVLIKSIYGGAAGSAIMAMAAAVRKSRGLRRE